MKQQRRIAVIVGILYIIGTVSGILNVFLTNEILNADEMVTAILDNKNQMLFGTMFILIMGFALALVPIVIFPVLKKVDETLAVGFLVFRGVLETVTYMGITVPYLLLVPYAQIYSMNETVSDFQIVSSNLIEVSNSISFLLVLVFSIGALIFYSALYKSKLVPRWLSIWGILAIVLHLIPGFAGLFIGTDISLTGENTWLTLLNFPIFLQEMVLAVWLIVKGFDISKLEPVEL